MTRRGRWWRGWRVAWGSGIPQRMENNEWGNQCILRVIRCLQFAVVFCSSLRHAQQKRRRRGPAA
jgi:hypothetical protein